MKAARSYSCGNRLLVAERGKIMERSRWIGAMFTSAGVQL